MSFERKRKTPSLELAQLKKEVTADKKVKLTLLMDKTDRIALKMIAASNQTTVTDIICNYVKEYIRKYGNTDKS